MLKETTDLSITVFTQIFLLYFRARNFARFCAQGNLPFAASFSAVFRIFNNNSLFADAFELLFSVKTYDICRNSAAVHQQNIFAHLVLFFCEVM